jgi:hypothetical protein
MLNRRDGSYSRDANNSKEANNNEISSSRKDVNKSRTPAKAGTLTAA